MARQHTVKDLQSGTTWLRCSVGQAWDPELDSCTGDIVKLDHAQIKYAISEAKRQLGGNWRLPTRQELREPGLRRVPCTQNKLRNISLIYLLKLTGVAIKMLSTQNVLVSEFHDGPLVLKIFPVPISPSFTGISRVITPLHLSVIKDSLKLK